MCNQDHAYFNANKELFSSHLQGLLDNERVVRNGQSHYIQLNYIFTVRVGIIFNRR
jgi:hypothetical protein